MPTVGSIEIRHVLGQGGFGKVYLGYDKALRKDVAVKIIDKDVVIQNSLQSYVEREIEMMRRIKHPHVVKLLNVVETKAAYHLVLELAPGGELFDKILESGRFNESVARSYFQQLISAVDYCHRHQIVHRDLKAENLLLGANGELKVCDFGLSRYTTSNQMSKDQKVLFRSLAGSIDYQAPEVIQEGGYEGSSCDMWSCGVILFFMLCGYLPFADASDELTRARILKCQYNKTSHFLPEGARELLTHLLDSNPNTRYNTTKVIEHDWFQKNLSPELFPEIFGAPGSPGSGHSSPKAGSYCVKKSNGSFPTPISPNTPSPNSDIDLYHQAFVSCNVNQTGFLSRDEIRDVLIKLNKGEVVPDSVIESFMKNFELDENGMISEEQFILGWTKEKGISTQYSIGKLANIFHFDLEQKLIQALRDIFNTLDGSHTGLLSPEDFTRLNLNCTEEEITQFFAAATANGHHLDFESFVHFITQHDIMKAHPVVRRLRRLEKVFDITEIQTFRHSVGTGFTVSGFREAILKKLIDNGPKEISTTFVNGEIEGYLYGSYSEEGVRVVEVGVQLLPAVIGYTKILSYRIAGKTHTFHQWFMKFRKFLRNEILMCEEDTAIKGESELM
jgi:serine/threonine protein kinase